MRFYVPLNPLLDCLLLGEKESARVHAHPKL